MKWQPDEDKTKVCTKCRKELPARAFQEYKDRRYTGLYLTAHCKECLKTDGSVIKARRKTAQKNYLAGKLPKWMYS